tara:strand:+ start:2889 stop:5429 length:2541 start_codon:yes stop_codon:yes gene_type:complete
MAFCRAFLAILILIQVCFANGIPQTIQYQGRFLDAATNRPVAGVVTKQIVFNIRKVEAGNIPGQIIDTHTASNVSVRDGVFNVEIPVSDNIKFDEPYGIEVIIQGSGGGNVGFQPFRSVPYAITAKNALFLGGISAGQYALTTHIHTSSGQKTFTIDGTGANLLSDDAQFKIINGAGQEVFRVTASGDIQKVTKINASGAIETEGSLRVVNQQQEDVFVADQNGNVVVGGDVIISGDSTVGSLEVSGDAVLKQVLISESLSFGPNASIDATPSDESDNLIGKSHLLEDHATSNLFTKLISLTNGSVVTASFHSHSLGVAELTSDAIADDSILSVHIRDGEITNDDIAANAAIDDTKLATISTAGKITTQALPVEVALRNGDNTFGAGFDPANVSALRTLNSFDSVRSKTFNVISTSSQIGSNFIDVRDFNAQFRWLLDGDGTLQFKRIVSGVGEQTRIEIKTEGSKTYIRLREVVFEGDPGMISGDVIADGGIQTNDIADGAVNTDKILDGSVIASKIGNLQVTEDKIADGAITAGKIGVGQITSNEIADGAITTAKILDGNITRDKVLSNTLTGDKLDNETITANEIANNTITTAKIASGAIQTNNIQDETLTNAKVADGAISNLNLNDNVLVSRVQPMSINLSTTTSPHITLNASSANAKFVDMVINNPSTISSPIPGVLISNQSDNQSVSLNLDGSISMKSVDFLQPVTLEPEIFAAMMGLPIGAGQCPIDNKGAYSLINPNDSAEDSGTGFCFQEFNSPETYPAALKACYDDSARLCSLSEIYEACSKGQVSIPLLSADLTHTTTIAYLKFTGQSNCGSVGDVTLDQSPIGNSSGYACCVNP